MAIWIVVFAGGMTPRALAEDFRSWHRVCVSAWQQDDWEVQLAAEGRWQEDSSRYHEQLLTAQVSYRLDETWSVGMAYTHDRCRINGRFENEHRWETEVGCRWQLADWVKLDLRNRLEIRSREGPGNGPERSRHRVQFTFPVQHAGVLQYVFVNNEFFYDYDAKQYNQNWLVPFGLGFKFNEHVQFRLYYAIQSVRGATEWGHSHVLGTQLHFRLK